MKQAPFFGEIQSVGEILSETPAGHASSAVKGLTVDTSSSPQAAFRVSPVPIDFENLILTVSEPQDDPQHQAGKATGSSILDSIPSKGQEVPKAIQSHTEMDIDLPDSITSSTAPDIF